MKQRHDCQENSRALHGGNSRPFHTLDGPQLCRTLPTSSLNADPPNASNRMPPRRKPPPTRFHWCDQVRRCIQVPIIRIATTFFFIAGVLVGYSILQFYEPENSHIIVPRPTGAPPSNHAAQHPIELFGKHTEAFPTINSAKSVESEERQLYEERRPFKDRLHNKTRYPPSRSVSKKTYEFDTAVVPFVLMVYRRLDYLKAVIESIMVSDFPRHRVPLIVSHDGSVPEMVEYVSSLKTEFPLLIQIVHPFSCYEHPYTFPGNDTSLNANYKGDAYGNLRSWEVTCCKHHFTWMLISVFTKIPELDKFDTFLFSEEDYMVAPFIYEAIVNGMNAIEEFENESNVEYFGLEFSKAHGNQISAIRLDDMDAWRISTFLSCPMTLSRRDFRKIQEHAAIYCGVDGFDEYNWDWSIVHMQSLGYVPHTVLIPSSLHPLAKHIGVQGGMHEHNILDGETLKPLKSTFRGTRVYVEAVNPPQEKKQGWGGWGHPSDINHCMSLFERPGESV